MCIATPINVPNARRGFTLVELMVVLVIIGLLASLTLAGLAGVRQRAKEAKTKSTIRKVHEIIMPQYESYLRRRVPNLRYGSGPPDPELPSVAFSVYIDTVSRDHYGPQAPPGDWLGPFNDNTAKKPPRVLAESRLQTVRTLMIYEMPDSWGDVPDIALTGVPSYARTGRVAGFASYKATIVPSPTHSSGECLFMIVSRGGLEPDVMEQFRADEVGDADTDGALEFHDAWKQPIAFIRWAPGISSGLTPAAVRPSLLQLADPANHHDPLDPVRIDATGYAMFPYVFSGGPDQVKALTIAPDSGWSPLVTTATSGLALMSITQPNTVITDLIGRLDSAADPTGRELLDNISNHDLLVR
jgi:prepilin-type N-terminal cleavage/methylation domain-containing protein